MKDLCLALKHKLKSDPRIQDAFGGRVYVLVRPDNVSVLTTAGKFPFIGISAENPIDVSYSDVGQQYDEEPRPRILIYHDHSTEEILFEELFDLRQEVMDVLNYDRDFEGTPYTAGDIIEARVAQKGGPIDFSTPEFPTAARIEFTMAYIRTIVEVLV